MRDSRVYRQLRVSSHWWLLSLACLNTGCMWHSRKDHSEGAVSRNAAAQIRDTLKNEKCDELAKELNIAETKQNVLMAITGLSALGWVLAAGADAQALKIAFPTVIAVSYPWALFSRRDVTDASIKRRQNACQ